MWSRLLGVDSPQHSQYAGPRHPAFISHRKQQAVSFVALAIAHLEHGNVPTLVDYR